MPFLFLDMLDVLGYIKSWPALYSELKRLHESDVVTDSEECSDVTVYVKNHSPSWRDIARAAYCCGEEAAMERIFKCNILKPIIIMILLCESQYIEIILGLCFVLIHPYFSCTFFG